MGNKNGKLEDKILSNEKENYSNNFDNNENISQKKNEIIIIIKIDENDINKDIYFLDNIDDELTIKPEHDKLEEMNESNTDLYINNIKYKYQKYLNFEKEGEYHIKIKLKFLMKDCSFMFYNCKNIINIDLSNFDTSNIINMERMFCCCENLININLSNFETKNVTSMRSMFYNCKKIKDLNLSTFDTRNVTNMKSMFNTCELLTYLDLSTFDT